MANGWRTWGNPRPWDELQFQAESLARRTTGLWPIPKRVEGNVSSVTNSR